MGTQTLPHPGESVAPGTLDIHARLVGGRWRMAIRGELGLETVDAAASELDRLAPSQVVLDLSGVTFIDSEGLTLLIRRAKRILLERTSTDVDRMIRLCGLESVLRYE